MGEFSRMLSYIAPKKKPSSSSSIVVDPVTGVLIKASESGCQKTQTKTSGYSSCSRLGIRNHSYHPGLLRKAQ